MGSLPSGTVTFAFTDVEGSTELLERLGDEYGRLLAEHRRVVREAVAAHGGEIVDARGEEFFTAFARAPDAVAAAVAIQRGHGEGPIRVRIGLHTGSPELSAEGYLGLDVHRAARICAAGHGGQILLSGATRSLLPDAEARDLGEHVLKGLAKPEHIFQLLELRLGSKFPPLRIQAAPQRRLGGLTSRVRRRREPTFEELAWQARGRMVGVDEPTRAALAELGAALFAAGRSDADGVRLLSRTDRRLLQRRLREHEELGTLSKRAREQAAVVQGQLDLLDEIVECRRALATSAGRAREATNPTTATAVSDSLASTTARLDHAITRARAELGSSAFRLRRTRYPGVRRAGDLFAVPSIDEAGIESVPTFATFREAKRYRRAQRLREKTFSSKVEAETVARAKREALEKSSGAGDWTGSGGAAGGDGGFG